MKDPKRLLDDGATANERAMLEAARTEGPSRGAARAARAAILLAALPPDGGASVGATGSSSVATASVGIGGAKLLAAAIAVATVVGGGAVYVMTRSVDAPPVEAPTVRIDRTSTPPVDHVASADAPPKHRETAVVVAAPSDRTAAPSAPSKRGAVRTPPPRVEPTAPVQLVELAKAIAAVEQVEPDTQPVVEFAGARLSREVLLVKTARDALDAGDAAAALVVIGVYESEFAAGTLREEAAAIAVDAAYASHAPDLVARAKRFLDDHPTGPHADHVRALLRSSEEKFDE